MKFGVLIVDDDIKNAEYLKPFVSALEQVSWVKTANCVQEAIEAIDAYNPNLIFLDVELQDGLGFDVLERCQFKNFSVIFITAHEKYALRAIKFSAIDYLLKPFSYDDVFQAFERLKSFPENNLKVLMENMNEQVFQEKRIGISSAQGVHYIKLKEVVRCEAHGNYTFFHLVGKKQELSSKPIKEYEEMLEEYSFVRIHKSHLINLFHVKSFMKNDGGSIIMTDDSEMPLSKTKKEDFLEKMKLIYV